MKRAFLAVIFACCAVLSAVAGVNNAVPITVNGLISFLGLTSGTSGGIPYFSGTNSLASSGVLASTAVVLGGGAGATPTTSGCTISSTNSMSCSSSTSFFPQLSLTNTTADATGPIFLGLKSRTGSDASSGDSMFTFFGQGFANSAYQNSVQISGTIAAASSGSNVPSKITFYTSNASAQLNQSMTFDNRAHLSFGGSLNPTVTGCGSSPSAVTGTDTAGQVTEGTTATGCTITFGVAYAGAPFCVVGLQTQQAAFTYTISTSAITVTNTSATGDKINWICSGA